MAVVCLQLLIFLGNCHHRLWRASSPLFIYLKDGFATGGYLHRDTMPILKQPNGRMNSVTIDHLNPAFVPSESPQLSTLTEPSQPSTAA